MGKGPTVTLTFAGDADKLRRTIGEVESATTTLDRGLSGLGKGLAGVTALGAGANLAAAGLIGGLGVAFVGLGVAAAAQSEKVKTAFTGLADHVKGEATKMAAPFEGVLVGIAGRAQATFDRVKPLLSGMFDVSAPYLDTLATGLLSFVEGALPGLKTALEQARPVIDAISAGIAGVGPKLGQMFTNITGDGGAERAAGAIATLFDWIGKLLPALGTAINFLGQWGPTLLPVAAFVYGIVGALRLWSAAQGLLNLVMAANPIGLWVIGIAALVAAVIWAWNNIDGFRNGVKAAWSAITSAFSTAVSAVGGFIGGLIGKVRAVPGQIMGALGNLGNLLVNSGRSLLEGLWRGAEGALQWVKQKFSDGLSAIRALFPFSPAKEGPFSGSGYTTLLRAARSWRDFGEGMEQGAPVDLGPTVIRGSVVALSSP
jgi:phage-related protein